MPTTQLIGDSEQANSLVLARAVERFREANIALPTFAQLADPALIPTGVRQKIAHIGPDEAEPLNLFRIHWHNDRARTGVVDVPEHLVLPRELTGVEARIVIALGDRFPLIRAHKVLAAYACLAPRLVTGGFDPTRQRAVWPSTGNYCRGGVAISRLMGCRGVAVLPEGMSKERFAWLDEWVADPDDIIRTPGAESNVKEVYDACKELAVDPDNVVLNQFAEFGNHVAHYLVTGHALSRVFESLLAEEPELRLRAFVAATGSAGTIAAGDFLKERFGSLIVACEALECPTMLRNGFGEHNIQGIGDQHIPLIHNVLNTDVALAVSDRATDRLGVLFGTEAGRSYLHERRAVPEETLEGAGLARPVEHLQRARRDQGREALPAGPARRDRDRGDRRRRHVRKRARDRAGEALPRRLRRRGRRRGVRRAHARRDHRQPAASSPRRSASGSSTSATSPGSSSRAFRSTTSSRDGIRPSGRERAASLPSGTR